MNLAEKKQKVEKLKTAHSFDVKPTFCWSCSTTVLGLIKELEAAWKALEWYADEHNYISHLAQDTQYFELGEPLIVEDFGHRAREALGLTPHDAKKD